MNVYTDPKLLDVRGALDVLPVLPLEIGPSAGRAALKATGTDVDKSFAPAFAPTSDKAKHLRSTPVHLNACSLADDGKSSTVSNPLIDKEKDLLTTTLINRSTGFVQGERGDLNPQPPDPQEVDLLPKKL
jgi:hypothetical protein